MSFETIVDTLQFQEHTAIIQCCVLCTQQSALAYLQYSHMQLLKCLLGCAKEYYFVLPLSYLVYKPRSVMKKSTSCMLCMRLYLSHANHMTNSIVCNILNLKCVITGETIKNADIL